MKTFKVDLVKATIDMTKGAFVLLGDFHHGNQTPHEILRERRMIRHLAKHPEYRIGLNGDIIDNPQVSNLPSDKIISIDKCLEETSKMLKPIYSQITCMDWGNHEERTFREPFGKGLAPNKLYGHFSLATEIQDVNPEAVYAPLMKGIHLNIETPVKSYSLLMKHGFRIVPFKEYDECLRTYQDLDVIMISHTHRPFVAPFCKINDDGTLKQGWFVRGGALTSWLPYQEKKNLPPSPLAFVKIPFRKGILRSPQIVTLL